MTDYDRKIIDRVWGARIKVLQAYNCQHEYGNHRPRVLLNLSADEVRAVIQGGG